MTTPALISPIPWHKKALSFVMPVKLQEFRSSDNEPFELYIRNGQLQLIFHNAIYSYGTAYKPFLVAFEHMPQLVRNACSMLVLGSGLGSIPRIVHEKYHRKDIAFTIVDIDKVILDLCSQHLHDKGIHNCRFVREDAAVFIRSGREQYDIICMDIFRDLQVPLPFIDYPFLSALAERLSTGGTLAFNYIAPEAGDEARVKMTLEDIFTDVRQVRYMRNTIFLATKKGAEQ